MRRQIHLDRLNASNIGVRAKVKDLRGQRMRDCNDGDFWAVNSIRRA
jgi:hypothetical protein